MAEEGNYSSVQLLGTLRGHKDQVTSLATCAEPGCIMSSSRDGKVILWQLKDAGIPPREDSLAFEDFHAVGYAQQAFTGHSSVVSQVVMNPEGTHAISSSWDSTVKIWDIAAGVCQATMKGHSKEVFCVDTSKGSSLIVSGGADKVIRQWSSSGQLIGEYRCPEQHTGWVSSVKYACEGDSQPVTFVSAGWDSRVKIWKPKQSHSVKNLCGHTNIINTLALSPDSSLCASAGRDCKIVLWDMQKANILFSLDQTSPIHSMCFSPSHYWLADCTDKGISIWDLENQQIFNQILSKGSGIITKAWATAVQWSSQGDYMYVGCKDGDIQVYRYFRQVTPQTVEAIA